MKLYYNPHSRAVIAKWMLDECGAEYEIVPIDFTKREHKTPEFLKVNPVGKLPALVDGDSKIFEGTAICCAFVPADDSVGPPEIRAALECVVPTYMIPSKWLAYDQLPRNSNGKVDRPRLREIFASRRPSDWTPQLEDPCRTRRY